MFPCKSRLFSGSFCITVRQCRPLFVRRIGTLLAPFWHVKYPGENDLVPTVDSTRGTLNIVDKTCGIVVRAFRVDATGPEPIYHPIDTIPDSTEETSPQLAQQAGGYVLVRPRGLRMPHSEVPPSYMLLYITAFSISSLHQTKPDQDRVPLLEPETCLSAPTFTHLRVSSNRMSPTRKLWAVHLGLRESKPRCRVPRDTCGRT